MNLRRNSRTLRKFYSDSECGRPPVGKKRKASEDAVGREQTKRARRETVYRRPLIEQLTPDTSSTNISAMRTCGPFLQGQFQDSSLRVAQLEEADLVNAMTKALTTTCGANEQKDRERPSILNGGPPYRSERYPDGSSSIFFSLTKPSIVLRKYLTRFMRYLNVSRSVFIVALIYLDRVCDEDELLAVRELNIHRLVTSSFCVAAKYLEDEAHRNASLARIGGVPTTEEMNMLEAQFLRRLHWNCFVPTGVYELYEERVIRTSENISQSQGVRSCAG